MKILQLSKFYKPYCGGVESVVGDLSEGLVHLNHQVLVLATDANGLQRTENIDGVSVLRSREFFSLAKVSVAPRYILDVVNNVNDFDVVHVHLPNPLANIALLFSLLFKKKSIKIVVHWHSDIVKQKKILKIYQPFVDRLLSIAEVIITTSDTYLQSSNQLSRFKEKCTVIPIGIESLAGKIDEEKVDIIKSLYSGKKIVFSLGRHVYYKGFEFLIEAAQNVDDTIFLIGGTGPDTKKYKSMIIEKGLTDKVFLIGRVDDSELANYYKAADIFCFPSIEKSEAFGVVQLEAMSLGTPIICCNISGSGVPWVNQDSYSGLVCEPKSSTSLAEALNTILTNDELIDSYSVNALKRFSKHFTKSVMVSKVCSIYHN